MKLCKMYIIVYRIEYNYMKNSLEFCIIVYKIVYDFI